MYLDYYKELAPVFYSADGLKTLYAEDFSPGRMCFAMHWHERMELLLITAGSLNLRVGNRETDLCAGSLAVITPGKLHYGVSGAGGVSYATIMFELNRFNCPLPAVKNLLDPILDKRTAFLPWTDQPEIIASVKSLLRLHHCEETSDQMAAVGKIYELTALLYRHCLISEDIKAVTDDRFRCVLDYMNLHYNEDISSDLLSRQFGYSPGYFSRHFKEITGLSPMIYIRILRLEKAGRLLLEEDLTVGETAAQCGFNDMSYFTKCFRTHFQMTPTEYVKRLR